MVTLPGYLAIRTTSGRNGEFNVGRLSNYSLWSSLP
ncbi:hypothetical protein ALQ05_200245 [Pseudomonas amygdali pv. mori]|uniref:Uncharacterized protein n=1 Tax=Pseudomonas amygdali pv. mori TaxID=34065 RepID=A0A0P9VB32_PSEA0|nr:hypothetical protein ALO63_05467 [Pseudomonas amygdali pv. mori]RMQ44417.1 hypothetical protein ALQ05_200245 [Pseudomonas amygdali pv. mori]RMT22813.1 hypothetical protein ALP52_05201 [Pseudomonas amygdali pv. mori]